MFYGSNEDKKNHIRKEAQALRLAASKIYLVKEVIRQFDGKVYSCRLDNAISDLSIDGFRFWCHKDSYGRFEISCTGNSRYITIFSCRIETGKENEYMTEKKRLKADNIIFALNTEYGNLMKKATELEAGADSIDMILEQVSKLKSMLNSVIGSVPYEVSDAYGLKRYW